MKTRTGWEEKLHIQHISGKMWEKERDILKFLLFWYLVINLTSFIMYGVDKRKAVRKAWRIPESRLILLAALGGGLGAWLGMRIFRHKTKHIKFIVFVPLFLILHIAWIAFLIFYVKVKW